MKVLLRLVLLVVVVLVVAAGWIAWTGDRARTDLLVARDEVDVILRRVGRRKSVDAMAAERRGLFRRR